MLPTAHIQKKREQERRDDAKTESESILSACF